MGLGKTLQRLGVDFAPKSLVSCDRKLLTRRNEKGALDINT